MIRHGISNRRKSPSAHMALYNYLQLLMRLGVSHCQILFSSPTCSGNCNQGRKPCNCK